MARENFLWGAPRIHGELLKLGFLVSQATVSRYMPEPYRRRSQTWRTFIQNQLEGIGPIELPIGRGITNRLRFQLRSRTRRSLLHLAKLIRAVFSVFRQSPAWPSVNSRLLWNVPGSSWATRRAIPGVRSAIGMPGHPWNASNGSRRATAQTRAPPYCARASPAPQANMSIVAIQSARRAGSRRGAVKSRRVRSRGPKLQPAAARIYRRVAVPCPAASCEP